MSGPYVIAILLCLGDNCDLVRPEPAVSYPSYEACSDATARNAGKLGEIAARSREGGREGEIICLREQHAADGGIPGASGRPAAAPAPATTKDARVPPPAQQPEPQGQVAVVTPPAVNAPQPAAPAPAVHESRDCEQCPAMVALPGGSLEMGSLADASERPVHRVQVAAFAIGKYEVTQREWKACIAAGACNDKLRIAGGNDQLPMMNLSWDDATQYAQWLRGVTGKSYRLPSEAEWEYAARAGAATPYPWGKEIGVAHANCSGCGGNYDPKLPAPVGSFPANAWGLHDMLGGVAEWTEDCWHKNYEGAPVDGSAWRAARCREHVLRGGSWKNPPSDLTVSSRNFYDASVRYIANGVRVAVASR